MGKALVLKNVNFSANKLTTVTIGDLIPCTGLSLSESTVTLSSIGATQQLTLTKTPANTTDTVEWSTSNSSVASVNNGLITSTGIGTATITATCGEQTATCTVTSKVVINADTELTVMHHWNINNSSNRDYISGTSSENNAHRSYYAVGNPLDGYKAVSREEDRWQDKYPIPIPTGATSLKISISSSGVFNYMRYAFCNANEKATNTSISASVRGARAYPYPYDISISGLTEKVFDLTEVDPNVNSFVFGLNSTSTYPDESSITGVTITVEFS